VPTHVRREQRHDCSGHADERLDGLAAGPQLASALASLPPDQGEVLLLFAWADLGYEEIARALDVPVGTVRSRLSRARERVRRELSGSEFFVTEAEGQTIRVKEGCR
jgi:RNA polymerase sigma-70 factor, ECF subfamily